MRLINFVVGVERKYKKSQQRTKATTSIPLIRSARRVAGDIICIQEKKINNELLYFKSETDL